MKELNDSSFLHKVDTYIYIYIYIFDTWLSRKYNLDAG